MNKAKIVCKNSGIEVDSQFMDIHKLVDRPQKGGKARLDYRLTRYACYLIAQNGDPEKLQISIAQTYFAIQTHKQEILEKQSELLQTREQENNILS